MIKSYCFTSLNRRQLLRLACSAGAALVAGGTRAAFSADAALSATLAGFVNSDGFKIHYETFGEGDPIVLVHGWGSSLKANWIDTGWVAALVKARRVVALDVRGHGDSDKPHQQSVYSYANMSRDVLRVMDHLQIAKADFLGYSMGAFMGVWLLAHSRERFTSMILGGIGDETDESLANLPKIVEGIRAKSAAERTDPVSVLIRAYVAQDARNDPEALAVSALQMWPESFSVKLGGPKLSEVDIPVLVVNGGNDHPYIDTAQKLIDAIPNSRLAVIADCDHLATVPDPRFKEQVLEFLARPK